MLYFIISLVTYFVYLFLKGRKHLTYFIGQKYNFQKIKLFNKENYLTLELLGVIIIILVFFLNSKTLGIIFLAFYTILSLIELKKAKSIKLDKTAIITIFITLFIYLISFIFILVDYLNYQKGFIFYDRINYYYIAVLILGYIEYIIIYFSCKLSKKIGPKK